MAAPPRGCCGWPAGPPPPCIASAAAGRSDPRRLSCSFPRSVGASDSLGVTERRSTLMADILLSQQQPVSEITRKVLPDAERAGPARAYGRRLDRPRQRLFFFF